MLNLALCDVTVQNICVEGIFVNYFNIIYFILYYFFLLTISDTYHAYIKRDVTFSVGSRFGAVKSFFIVNKSLHFRFFPAMRGVSAQASSAHGIRPSVLPSHSAPSPHPFPSALAAGSQAAAAESSRLACR